MTKTTNRRINPDMNIIIRNEIESDIEAISEITEAAFATLAISQHTEQFIIYALREAKALTLSLVAEVDNRVAGHIAFSPVTISDDSADWYGIGPVSVLPKLQRQGIGKALIHEGLSLLKALGAKGCVLVGDPGYYERFGFKNIPELLIDGVPQQYFLALPFEENASRGTVVFHEGFAAKE
jgi:putative acetyltransferase